MCWCACLSDCCLIILSVLFPPLPVWIRRGFCSCDSLINILLSILGYLPGLIHSWYIIAKYPPYGTHGDTKIYYIYRNDIENQTPNPHRHEHHYHHHHNTHVHQPIRNEPLAAQTPVSYGAVSEGSSSRPANANGNAIAPANAPPEYTEFDNKTQR